MRIALAVEYAGTGFAGWQSQPQGSGVQDALEAALAAIAGVPVRTVAAGRTDAGVHATLQVAHFDAPVTRPLTAWVRGVNAHLPADVAVLWAHPVADVFHARFAASARHYTYLLLDRPSRGALLADRLGWYHRPLDVARMQAAAAALVGTHDFSAFRASECQAKSPVKSLSRAHVLRDGEIVRLEFSADAFLHHMIRNIVGALVQIGAGRQHPDWMRILLEGRDRTRGAPTFGPQGLYFTGADYPAVHALPGTRREIALSLGSLG